MQPYNDDYLRYDELTGHYALTEKALTDNLGLDLRSRLSEGATVNPEAVINSFLRLASDMVYGFIYKHNANNKKQAAIIRCLPYSPYIGRSRHGGWL